MVQFSKYTKYCLIVIKNTLEMFKFFLLITMLDIFVNNFCELKIFKFISEHFKL